MNDDRTYVTQARVFVVKHLREFTPKGIERVAFDHLVRALEHFDAVLGNGASVTCPECGWTSYHPDDIRARYCGHCHNSHSDRPNCECRCSFFAHAEAVSKNNGCTQCECQRYRPTTSHIEGSKA